MDVFAAPVVAVTLETSLTPHTFRTNLEQAWLYLRTRAPSLACTLAHTFDGSNHHFELVYRIPTEKALEHWVKETLIERNAITQEKFVYDICNSSEVSAWPGIDSQASVTRLFWSRGSKHGQYHLMIMTCHHVCDGRGCLQVSCPCYTCQPDRDSYFGPGAAYFAILYGKPSYFPKNRMGRGGLSPNFEYRIRYWDAMRWRQSPIWNRANHASNAGNE